MGRVNIKKGDVFCVAIDLTKKKYFQYVDKDITQLNTYVIRGFRKEYYANDNPSIEDIVKDEVSFYAHCLIKLGIKLKAWVKIGTAVVENAHDILFKVCDDYGRKMDQEPIKVSHNWWVWEINTPQKYKGDLPEKYSNAFIGIVYNPNNIVELLKGNPNPANYPS